MKERFEFKNIENDLFDISECPNFSDQERNCASELLTSLKNTEEPTIEEYRERISRVKSYLNTGVVLETGVIMDILNDV